MGCGVLGLGHLEAVALAERVLVLCGGEVERTLADLLRLHAGEQLGRTGHNKFMWRVD